MPIIVITGASGGGKSSLIDALSQRGFRVQPEIGREIVREQAEEGGDATPWQDRVVFRDLLFQRSIEAYDKWKAEAALVFFDRSFVEALAYSRVIGAPVPERMKQDALARPFHKTVFICPPWREIFANDSERKHDFDFALKDYEANAAEYAGLGYELLEVPKKSVSERLEFVLKHMVG